MTMTFSFSFPFPFSSHSHFDLDFDFDLIFIFIFFIAIHTIIMEIIFMNTENNKTKEPHRFKLDLADKRNLKYPNKNIALVN